LRVANRARKFTPRVAGRDREGHRRDRRHYRQIAARHGCAVATVQTIADENNLRDRWQDGQQQTAATSVKQSNAAALRADLQVDLLGDVAKLRDRLFGDVTPPRREGLPAGCRSRRGRRVPRQLVRPAA
jgi:hypothetical protein